MPRLKQEKSTKRPSQQAVPNGSPCTGADTSWKPHLSQYPEQRILTFGSAKEFDRAIDLLWSKELRDLPHDSPDGKSLVVPAEAVACFRRAGLKFTENRFASISELSGEQIRRLRR